MRHKTFTREEDRMILDARASGAPYAEIAAQMGRTPASVQAREFRLRHGAERSAYKMSAWNPATVAPPVFERDEKLRDGATLFESAIVSAEAGGTIFLARFEKIEHDAYMTFGWRAEDGARRKVEHWLFVPTLPGSNGANNG